MCKLIDQWQIGRKQSFSLYSSSPGSTAIIINNLNKCTVWSLHIQGTSLDSKCISIIIIRDTKNNKTIKIMAVHSLYLLVVSNKSVIVSLLYITDKTTSLQYFTEWWQYQDYNYVHHLLKILQYVNYGYQATWRVL